ncbi:hypothetical protein ACFFGH_02735 [Lysobacter korlensis]|uniref:Uncharacterized protein n=1 Tax=Lysobacter korlensis TaxID=553636 RepID=A0ABV6RIF0_9GAMM
MTPQFAYIQQATQQDFAAATGAVCVFSRHDVEQGLIGQAVDRLMQMSDDNDLSLRMEGAVFLVFEGYDDDPRELYHIEECVHFFRAVTEEWPYWFHFLERERGSLGIALRLLVDVVNIEGDDGATRAAVVAERLDATLLRLFGAMDGLQQRLDLDEEHTLQASREILKALDLS